MIPAWLSDLGRAAPSGFLAYSVVSLLVIYRLLIWRDEAAPPIETRRLYSFYQLWLVLVPWPTRWQAEIATGHILAFAKWRRRSRVVFLVALCLWVAMAGVFFLSILAIDGRVR